MSFSEAVMMINPKGVTESLIKKRIELFLKDAKKRAADGPAPKKRRILGVDSESD